MLRRLRYEWPRRMPSLIPIGVAAERQFHPFDEESWHCHIPVINPDSAKHIVQPALKIPFQPVEPFPESYAVLWALLAVVGCAALLIVLIAWLDPSLPQPFGIETLSLATLSALPFLLVFALLLALTRRVLLAGWLTALLIAALYAINAAKIQFLETQLLPADFRLLAEPGPALQLFGQYLSFSARAAFAVVVGGLITLLLWRRPRWPRLIGLRRWGLAVGSVFLGASLIAGSPPWKRVFNSERLGFHPWVLGDSGVHIGLINSLLLYHWELGAGTIPKADRAVALQLLQEHAAQIRERLAAIDATGEPPDIVILQSESLFDPALLQGVDSGRFLREFYKLAKQSLSGQMSVPTFGGGTVRTEFEVLTGTPLASLGGVQYPWLELHDAHLPTLASTLRRNGYRTIAIHPNSAGFWNRGKVYPQLGFDRFIDVKSFSPSAIVGLFTSDAALTDKILDELPGDGPPRFLFAISMENHGPFDWRPNLDPTRLAALPMPKTLDEGGRYWLGNYLYLLDDADHELGRLVTALRERKRRTLLLFYGDHLPALPPVYAGLGFKNGRDPQEQQVPWLLYDTAHPKRATLDTHSWLLPSLVLRSAGIRDDTYFTVLDSLRESLALDGALPDDIAQSLESLTRLQLRGELAPVLEEGLRENAAALTAAP